jgi:choline dehydrogenase-like flavoprotein
VPIPVYDIAIIGGGINGCGIARDAAGRGLTVHLCEQGDLAGATSSASSKLFHGGVRFNRSSKFRDLRERLAEQDLLLANAPHLVRPLRIVLPIGSKPKPGFVRRAKNFAVDHRPVRSISKRNRPAGRSVANTGPGSSFRTAGSTTPDWSSPTPSTRGRTGRISIPGRAALRHGVPTATGACFSNRPRPGNAGKSRRGRSSTPPVHGSLTCSSM